MSLLRDVDLVELLEQRPTVIAGLPKTADADIYSAKSPIQPSSIDLHVGRISIPTELPDGEPKTIDKGDYTLPPGATAVIRTQEVLNLPKDLAAVGFPPNHVSGKGLLMINPGHVDPGYAGKLHLTVINMSRSSISLRCGDGILTLIFYKLDGECKAGYKERVEESSDPPTNLLSPDFLDITKRAKEIANEAVKTSAIYAGLIALTITLLSTVLPYYFDTKREIAVLTEKNQTLKESLTSIQAQMVVEQGKIESLEYDRAAQELKSKPPPNTVQGPK